MIDLSDDEAGVALSAIEWLLRQDPRRVSADDKRVRGALKSARLKLREAFEREGIALIEERRP
jgi:hypothetical protein